MPKPQLRANAVSDALTELKRMEDRRGCYTQLDERRLYRELDKLDGSAESEVARAAIRAQWNRQFAEFDAAVMNLLEMENLSHPGSLYVNFSLMSLRALNADLASQLNRKAFRANQTDPEFLIHVLRNSWYSGDLDTYQEIIDQLAKLKYDGLDELYAPLDTAKNALGRESLSYSEYQRHVQRISQLVRGFLVNRPEVYLLAGIEPETHEDGHEELVLEFDLGLDDDTLDAIDEALLELRSDADRVNPALNKCIGVLVRDYPQSVSAEAS